MKRYMIVITILALSLSALVACAEQPNEETVNGGDAHEDAVAIVNGQAISKDELERQLDQIKEAMAQQGLDLDSDEAAETLEQYETMIVEQLINQELLLQAATEAGFSADAAEVEENMTLFKENYFETEDDFNNFLEENNYTEEEIYALMAEQIKIENYVVDQIGEVTISDEELQEAIDQLKAQFEDVDESDLDEMKPFIEEQVKMEKFQTLEKELIESLKEDSDIQILI